MQVEIVFDYLPPTLNELIKIAKQNPRQYARLKREYTRDCAITALGNPQFTGKVWISCHWHVKTLRRDPADNTPAALKCILDGLVDAGILKDDSGFVIQPPLVHSWELATQEGCKLLISDRPIYTITSNE